ncbi:MAG: hypothetical protein IPN69_14625 [Acidobacteria bacterium]|nr:hypothetical protein [Acidobacteriota bacterium]
MRRIVLIISFWACLILMPSSSVPAQQSSGIVSLSISVVEFSAKSMQVNYSVRNDTQSAIYVATKPTTLSGEIGFYRSLDGDNLSTLVLSSRVYEDPPYFVYLDNRGVLLIKLDPGVEYTDRITIAVPIKETDPPRYRKRLAPATIRTKNLRCVELAIGYFNDIPGVSAFLKKKKWGWNIVGTEELNVASNKTSTFLEIQQMVTSKICDLKNLKK